MTVRETVQKDGVGMRWVRTAATTIVAVAGALGVVWSGFIWIVEPRFEGWAREVVDKATADLRADNVETNNHIDRLGEVVTRLELNVTKLGEAVQGNVAPSWRFDYPSTSISDGHIGGRVQITAGGFKLRECGIPRVDLYFINGKGTYHRFEDASLLSNENRGVAFPVDPDRLQTVTYTAEIPADDGVSPGRGQGFIAVTYPDSCPHVEEVIAGPLQFRILPQQE